MSYEDEKMVTEFLERERDFLWARAMGLTHKGEDAEDLYQDTVVKIFQGWNSFDPDTNFRAWASRIMLNTHLNNVARHKDSVSYDFASSASENAIYHLAEEDGVSYSENPEKIFFLKHIDSRLIHALYSLPDEFRKPFSLFHFEGFAYEEIAKMLDLPIGTIKSRIFRARKNLKEMLEGRLGRERLN